MSLMNDALRDLDEMESVRRSKSQNVLNNVTPIPSENNEGRREKKALKILVQSAVFGIFFTTVAYIGFIFVTKKISSMGPSSTGLLIENKSEVPITLNSMAQVNTVTDIKNIVVESEWIGSEKKIIQTISSDLSPTSTKIDMLDSKQAIIDQQVLELNKKGYAALADNLLSTPAGKSAIDYFRQVLVLDQQNAFALQGIDFIHKRYQRFIENKIKNNDVAGAQTMLQRFVSVDGDNDIIADYRQAIDSLRDLELITYDPNNPTQRFDIALTTSPVPMKSSESILPDIDHVMTQAVLGHENTNVMVNHISVEKSTYQIEREIYLRSQEWLQLQQPQKAKNALAELLVKQGYLTKLSAESLFDLYLQSGELESAQQLGNRVKNISTTPFAVNNSSHDSNSAIETTGNWDHIYEEARIAQFITGDAAALEKFKAYKYDQLGESSARLYAALLQKNGDYAESQYLYQQLLNMNQNQVTYWLGYGIASDALGQIERAVTAYQKSQHLGGMSAAVQQYVVERLQLLSQNQRVNQQPTVKPLTELFLPSSLPIGSFYAGVNSSW